jgi:hypothetical protein
MNQEMKATAASIQTKAQKPLVAQCCTALAWISLIFGVPILFAGISEFIRNHPAAAGHTGFGIVLISSAMFWFVASRVITLLAEIAHNTARPKTPGET